MNIQLFNRTSDVLKDMATSSDVYIYGAGEYGHDIYKVLVSRGINVRAFAVDDQYYRDSTADIRKLSDVLQQLKQNKGYLIWGIAKPSSLRNAVEKEIFPEVWVTYDVYEMWEDKKFAHKHAAEFDVTRTLLADDYSRQIFDAYLKIYDGDPSADLDIAEDGTYFNELTKNIRGGGYVDCGAYIGDSIQTFVKAYDRNRKIYAFEPDYENYKKLLENTKGLDVVAVQAGTWSTRTTLCFAAGNDAASTIRREGSIQIKTDTIDNIVGENIIAFIKMDVEGSELEALKGASQVIKRDMPVLAISAYHKQEDLITLPQFIADCENKEFKYDLYLRHHGCCVPELVLYGIPTKR